MGPRLGGEGLGDDLVLARRRPDLQPLLLLDLADLEGDLGAAVQERRRAPCRSGRSRPGGSPASGRAWRRAAARAVGGRGRGGSGGLAGHRSHSAADGRTQEPRQVSDATRSVISGYKNRDRLSSRFSRGTGTGSFPCASPIGVEIMHGGSRRGGRVPRTVVTSSAKFAVAGFRRPRSPAANLAVASEGIRAMPARLARMFLLCKSSTISRIGREPSALALALLRLSSRWDARSRGCGMRRLRRPGPGLRHVPDASSHDAGFGSVRPLPRHRSIVGKEMGRGGR